MKYIFVDSYNLIWNGYTARYEKGISGSHNSLMYLAEGLAMDLNNEVIIVSTHNNLIEGEYLNVKYINDCNFNVTNCDYIVMLNNLNSLIILKKIIDYNKIIILMANDLCNYKNFFDIEIDRFIICYTSQVSKNNILLINPFLNNYKNFLLYNSIDLNDIINIDNEVILKKENSLCFFACIDRGLELVEKIIDILDNYILYINNYCEYQTNITNKIIKTENTSKENIFKYMIKSKYFIYPLINLVDNNIHYDTFAYVVLESLLLGVIVIAPRKKIFEEIYGDAICYIDTDDIIPVDDLTYWKKNNSNFGYPIMDRYIEKINLLDNDETLRNEYINKGLSIKDKFSNIKLSNDFVNILEDFKKQEENKK